MHGRAELVLVHQGRAHKRSARVRAPPRGPHGSRSRRGPAPIAEAREARAARRAARRRGWSGCCRLWAPSARSPEGGAVSSRVRVHAKACALVRAPSGYECPESAAESAAATPRYSPHQVLPARVAECARRAWPRSVSRGYRAALTRWAAEALDADARREIGLRRAIAATTGQRSL